MPNERSPNFPDAESTEFRQFDGQARELYKGNAFEVPSPTPAYVHASRFMAHNLEKWIEEKEHGVLYSRPINLILDAENIFIPAFVYYETEENFKVEHPEGQGLVGTPDLVIEFIFSRFTGGRERVLKHRAYATFGVKRYWIIDLEYQIMHAFVLQGGRYQDEAVLIAGETFSPTVFPGLSISLKELFGLPADHPAPFVTRDVPLTSR